MFLRSSGRVALMCAGMAVASHSFAFGIFGNSGLSGGFRWDAAPRMAGGVERSLDGGLRYSLQGGSFQSYRDSFSWSGGTPTVAAFQNAVQSAFESWRKVDAISGLGTSLTFNADFGTAVSTIASGGVRFGAEIDLFAVTSASSWGFGSGGLQGEAIFNVVAAGANGMTLTSGTTNYAGAAIGGADVFMNSNTQATWTLATFETVLTHEIGHTLGLADVDFNSGPNGTFIDDNYNNASNATALATLTNSFASLIDPLDPSASPLNLYTVANGAPGFDTNGVEILMESSISGFFVGNPNMMQNDDFAGRQFLYPYMPVPEPATIAALGLGGLALLRRRCNRKA